MAKKFRYRKVSSAGILEFKITQVGPYVGEQTEFRIDRPQQAPVFVSGLATDAVEIAEAGAPEPLPEPLT